MATNTHWAEKQQAHLGVAIRRNIRIPTQDTAVSLSADLYMPAEAARVPALLTAIPYRKDFFGGRNYERSLRFFAEHGYAGMLLNLRGVGSSDGIQRPRMDPGEADDGVAAIEWLAAQPWCSGAVGMWGMSYGGAMALRTATRHPTALKAIAPISCPVSPERYKEDRGDFGFLAQWGAQRLVEQLLPPLDDYTSRQEQERWRRRRHEAEPVALDMARHRPGGPDWRARVIDPRVITAPAFCVGGWQDAYADEVTHVYEQLSGPKKLLVGPWTHTLPQHSKLEAIDFPSMLLRWWDFWLRDIDNGVMDEPPVTLYTIGHRSGWRTYKNWPASTDETLLAAPEDLSVYVPESDEVAPPDMLGVYHSDPTIGAFSGLGGETIGVGLPVDQHEDDCRALSATTAPLPSDLLICGRPDITVRLAHATDTAPRIVARLTHVDPNGRSLMITKGSATIPLGVDEHRITLRPTTYRVPSGHRLRVVLSDSDFPLLTPLPGRHSIPLQELAAAIPTTTDTDGTPVDIPSAEQSTQKTAQESRRADRWTITRDLVNDGVKVTVGSTVAGLSINGQHTLERKTDTCAVVRRAAADATHAIGDHRTVAHMSTGETITVTAVARCTQTTLWLRGEVIVDGLMIFSRIWETNLGWETGSAVLAAPSTQGSIEGDQHAHSHRST